MNTPDALAFEQAVRDAFAFLETDGIAHFRNTQLQNHDPRDAAVIVYFENEAARIAVAYAWLEGRVVLSIVLGRDTLRPKDRGVYVGPWALHRSNGEVRPVTPFYFPAMAGVAGSKPEPGRLTQRDLRAILQTEAARLRSYYPDILGASDEDIRAHQSWLWNFRG